MPERNDNRSGRKSQGSSRQQGERRTGNRQQEQSDRGSTRQQGEMDPDDEGRFSNR